MNQIKQNIAIIASDLHYFNASICSGTYANLIKAGYHTHIYLTYEKEENEKKYVTQILNQSDIAGIIIFSCLSQSAFYGEILKKTSIPCIFIDRLLPYLSHYNFITVDNYGGANKIGQLLIEKGAKKIACLSMLKRNHLCNMEDRINGFRDSHIHLNNIHCFREELEYEHTIQSLEKVLKKWENENNFPDAVFASNHLIMNGLISLIKQNTNWQKRFKDSILSCFDNLEYFDWIDIPIISVEQNINDIVFYASNILLNKIKECSTPTFSNIILPVTIIDRTKK